MVMIPNRKGTLHMHTSSRSRGSVAVRCINLSALEVLFVHYCVLYLGTGNHHVRYQGMVEGLPGAPRAVRGLGAQEDCPACRSSALGGCEPPSAEKLHETLQLPVGQQQGATATAEAATGGVGR